MVIYPNAGALFVAGLVRTGLAGCKLKLFKDGAGIILGAGTTQADLAAAECDFPGYAAITVAAMTAPLLNPVGGASISTGTQQFALAAPFTAQVVGGGWLEDSTGKLVVAWSYDPAISLAADGDGVPVEIVLVYG